MFGRVRVAGAALRSEAMQATPWQLELTDYRRCVAESYGRVMSGADGASEDPAAWRAWRGRRDRLIGTHPQSPLPADRRDPAWTTPFFDHDPAWRLSGVLTLASSPAVMDIPHSSTGTTRFVEVGTVKVEPPSVAAVPLTLFWLDAYGGGLFLPFRDATRGSSTYGGGRYLLDTVKGADLGQTPDGRLVLDFNYAYHPSCAWDAAWSCPLAPPSNDLDLAVRAGERLPLGVRD